MPSYIKTIVAATFLARLVSSNSGSGQTTRYWDCCKPSCAWPKSGLTSPVKVCDASNKPLNDVNAKSGCEGGTAFMCSDQTPWAINDKLAYGFGAVSAGGNPPCCACYKLTFTSTAIKGKQMIIQATNTGGDVSAAQFDLAMPGGGFGIYDACTTQWKATSAVWGKQYGGSATNTCSQFPSAMQPGCGFRWDWMQGADNPTVDYETVACPAELVAKSGCSVAGSTPAKGDSSSSSSPSSPQQPPSSPPASSSSSSAAAAAQPSAAAAAKPEKSNWAQQYGNGDGGRGSSFSTAVAGQEPSAVPAASGGAEVGDEEGDECEL